MSADLPPTFTCEVVRVHDGDGPLWCRSGQKVRVAGVQSPDFTNAEPCRHRRAGYVCNDGAAKRARDVATRLTLHRRLSCRSVDRSYDRIVARCTLPDGRSLSCALLAAGAAQRWDRYWRRYKMVECR
jgi:endonuclease YncB( thermonuclease family)